jgi:hypothetical protein
MQQQAAVQRILPSSALQGSNFFKDKRMTRLVLTLALGAAMISTAAVAQDEHGGRGGWAQQDMTRQQAQQMADGMFQRFDANHDGVISREEATQAAAQLGGGERAQKMIDRAFGSAQSLTLQQFEAQALGRFDRDDANHDGVVTAAERQQARAQLKADRAGANPGQ